MVKLEMSTQLVETANTIQNTSNIIKKINPSCSSASSSSSSTTTSSPSCSNKNNIASINMASTASHHQIMNDINNISSIQHNSINENDLSLNTNDIDVDFGSFKMKKDLLKTSSSMNYNNIANNNTNNYIKNSSNLNGNNYNNGNNNENLNDVKVQVYYCGIIMVIYIRDNLRLEELMDILRDICKFDKQQLFTIKWVDEEGDPCSLSSQIELNEALRLYYLNKESELIMHVFANIPERPGMQCAGEDRSIYRRGARRWRKIYMVNGHKYQAKRFARTALCKVCQDRIWGLGRQGYKCLECKIMVHKRCHKYINLLCSDILMQQHQQQQQIMNNFINNTNISTPIVINDDLSLKEKHKQAIRHQQPSIKESNGTLNSNKNKQSFKANNLNEQKILNEIPINELEVNDNVNLVNNKDLLAPTLKTPIAKIDTQNGVSSKGSIGLDQFDLIKVIGRGSYAKVFLVEYRKTRKCYAMKVIKKSIVDDDEDIDWVQTEKHVFEQATNHPFLVGLHSCFQTESRLFFVIEYLCGGDLMYHMQRKRRLPEDHARFYSAEISVALGFLHSKGIIYRDLKLDNVLLDIEGHIKLTDYGMCKEGLSKTERTSTFCGTPNYIAPEMLRGEDYDFSVDWWALGVLLYEMMAGRSPFEPVNENPGDNPDLNTEDHLFQVILEKPIRIPRSLSVRAASVLKGFLQKTPSERLASHDGLNEIKQHLFFKPIDWDLLEQRQIQPPYKPPVQNERDLNNIDELFTREPVILTPDTPRTLSRIQQNEFEGFEYINPLILSDEIPV